MTTAAPSFNLTDPPAPAPVAETLTISTADLETMLARAVAAGQASAQPAPVADGVGVAAEATILSLNELMHTIVEAVSGRLHTEAAVRSVHASVDVHFPADEPSDG